jgi:riboflavin kinase/FMN adenylyltransferase
VIAPGNHDGVHLGHRALIRSARAFAHTHGLETCALTFDPHPLSVVDATRTKAMLTQLPRRQELLLRAGADRVHVQAFTPEFAALSPEAFVDVLLEQGARALVIGPDFRFGCNRAGDVELLHRLAEQRDFSVLIEPPVVIEGERVSSTAIRETLRAGDVAHAAQLLGRLHEITGRVVQGDRRGRTIGFPTANLDPEPVLPPLDGVYAVRARVLDDETGALYDGVANLGTRPTFAAGRSLEVHLFDFDRDIYDKTLRVGFVARVRGEQRFNGLPELRAQIGLDCDSARATLQRSPSELAACL